MISCNFPFVLLLLNYLLGFLQPFKSEQISRVLLNLKLSSNEGQKHGKFHFFLGEEIGGRNRHERTVNSCEISSFLIKIYMKGEQPKEQGKDEQRRFKRQRVEMVGQVLRVEDFFEERSREIQILEQAISQSRANQKLRVFQTVQRYQRRRAASHNPKRLPKHLRLRAIEQMQRDKNPNPGEMPRRKKRNPKRLAEFKTMGKKWLETHIWHAKRMKMVSRNGIMAALTPNQKCFRSMYRAAKNEATCVDSSWKKIIEIIGNRAELSKLLESIADPSLSSFSAEMYVFGNRAGKQFIHDKNEWPLGAICPVDFLWKPEEGDSGKTIWIWVDSYCFDVVHDFILRLKSPNINLRKIETMNRFEIDGPRSHAILSHTLVLANDNSLWNSYRDLSTPGVLQEGVVCALDIQDPRLIFPRLMPPKSGPANETSQQNLELNEIGQHALIKWPLDSARGSKIWDLEHQKGILTSRATNSEISARRSKVIHNRLP